MRVAFFVIANFISLFSFCQGHDTINNEIVLVNKEALLKEYCKNSSIPWVTVPCRGDAFVEGVSVVYTNPKSRTGKDLTLAVRVLLINEDNVPIARQKVKICGDYGIVYQELKTDNKGSAYFTRFTNKNVMYLRLNREGKCEELEIKFFFDVQNSMDLQMAVVIKS